MSRPGEPPVHDHGGRLWLWLRVRRDPAHAPRVGPLAAAVVVAVVAGAAGLAIGVHTGGRAGGPAAGGATSPPARAGASLGYDPDSATTLLFGGTGADGASLADTWSWDGSGWTRLHPAVSPPARTGAAMAWDASRHRMVLVGGTAEDRQPGPCVPDGAVCASGGFACAQPASPVPTAKKLTPCAATAVNGSVAIRQLTDTWTWDGSTWTQAHPAHSPGGGPGGVIAWDAHDQVVVLSRQTAGVVVPLASPPTSSSAMVRCLPVGAAKDEQPTAGGTTGSGPAVAPLPCLMQPRTSTWTWDGRDWTARDAAGGAPVSLASDPTSGRVIGLAPLPVTCATGSRGDASTGATQAPLVPCPLPAQPAEPPGVPVPPPPASAAPGVPAPGASGSAPASHGVTVRPLPAVATPRLDPAQGESRTLTWSGSWSQAVGSQPLPALGAALATDQAHGAVLALTLDASTWSWDGHSWHHLRPAASPAGERLGAAMAADPHGVVLFGGYVRGRAAGDTWTWDGVTWTHRAGSVPPPPSLPPVPPRPSFGCTLPLPGLVGPPSPNATAAPSPPPTFRSPVCPSKLPAPVAPQGGPPTAP